jgi:hypothetical protein
MVDQSTCSHSVSCGGSAAASVSGVAEQPEKPYWLRGTEPREKAVRGRCGLPKSFAAVR